jgi:hypothetical protein
MRRTALAALLVTVLASLALAAAPATRPVEAASPATSPEAKLAQLIYRRTSLEQSLAQLDSTLGRQHGTVRSMRAARDELSRRIEALLIEYPELKPQADLASAPPQPGDEVMPDDATVRAIAEKDAVFSMECLLRSEMKATVEAFQIYGTKYPLRLQTERALRECELRVARYANAYLRAHPKPAATKP